MRNTLLRLVFIVRGATQGRLDMWAICTALAAIAFAVAFSAHSARAEITYPWCGQYGDPDGIRNCGFSTLEQCRAAMSGNGGFCLENPMYRPGADNAPAPRRPRR